MRRLCWTIVVFIGWITVSASAAGPATTRPADDLSGAWLVDSVSGGISPHTIIRSRLTLTDHTFSLVGYWGLSNPWTGTFKLGPGATLDLHADPYDESAHGTSSVQPGGNVHGIYRLEPSTEGDRLTLCFAQHENQPRPTEFTAADGVRLASFIRVGRTFADWPKDVTVTVLDPTGHPAPGAAVFNYMGRDHTSTFDQKIQGWTLNMKSPIADHYTDVATTNSDGTAKLPYSAFEDAVAAPAGAHLAARGWIGFAHISPAALRQGMLTIRMQPQRIVHGTLTSDELAKAGDAVPWRAVYLYTADNNRMLWSTAADGSFRFALSPGTYELYAYGNDLGRHTQTLTIPAGVGDIEAPPISLTPTRILAMIGHAPPPLRGVVAWKNSPANPSDFKGKVVLVHFWGYWCGNCVIEMPQLMRVARKYQSRGLVVIGVHVDAGDDQIDSAAKLDARTALYRNGIWKGQDLPFPVALVSGQSAETGHCLAATDYGISYYPSTVVINRDGHVLGLDRNQVQLDFGSDAKTIDAAIERLLAAH